MQKIVGNLSDIKNIGLKGIDISELINMINHNFYIRIEVMYNAYCLCK